MKKKLDKRELLTQHTLYKSALLKIYKQSVEKRPGRAEVL